MAEQNQNVDYLNNELPASSYPQFAVPLGLVQVSSQPPQLAMQQMYELDRQLDVVQNQLRQGRRMALAADPVPIDPRFNKMSGQLNKLYCNILDNWKPPKGTKPQKLTPEQQQVIDQFCAKYREK